MGEAQRRTQNGRLLVPDGRLVNVNGGPLSAGTAAQAAGVKHYGVTLVENGRVVKQTALNDPFIRVQIVVKGWRKAWQVLRGRYGLEVRVDDTEQAMKDVYGAHGIIRP